jgi:hypothetical protein
MDRYVVKLKGSLESREVALLCELFASRLAQHFGILIPRPAIVDISADFSDLVAARQPAIGPKIRQSVGANFGCELITGGGTWPVSKSIPEGMYDAALNIFAFDALIQNPDRRFNNPNLISRGDEIFAYDHESAFSFLFAVGPSMTPWTLENERYLDDHVFFRQLRSIENGLVGFGGRLAALTDEVLDEIEIDVPAIWRGDASGKIRAHLRAIREHGDQFCAAIEGRLR